MPTYGMGEAIREMRTRFGYTQEELSYGICTPGTLSRIENGRAVVSKQVFEALCQRMPGLHHVWISFDTKKEMQRSKLCKQILMNLELRRMDAAKSGIESYEELTEKENPFCRQFILYTQAIYQAIKKERIYEVLPKLKEALAITLPDFKERLYAQKKAVMLTYDEMYILSNMGIAYVQENKEEDALSIFDFLRRYIERQKLDLAESMRVRPMILGNLAWTLEREGRFEEAVRYCDAGIENCCFTGKFADLPHLLCIKAWCLTASGNLSMSKKSRRQAKAILDITEEYRGYGSFKEFYQAREPIFVTF